MVILYQEQKSDLAISRVFYFHEISHMRGFCENKTLAKKSDFTVKYLTCL